MFIYFFATIILCSDISNSPKGEKDDWGTNDGFGVNSFWFGCCVCKPHSQIKNKQNIVFVSSVVRSFSFVSILGFLRCIFIILSHSYSPEKKTFCLTISTIIITLFTCIFTLCVQSTTSDMKFQTVLQTIHPSIHLPFVRFSSPSKRLLHYYICISFRPSVCMYIFILLLGKWKITDILFL